MSAGIGGVPAAQTYLDITQGNRVSESLYDDELPSIGFDRAGVEAADWEVDLPAGRPTHRPNWCPGSSRLRSPKPG